MKPVVSSIVALAIAIAPFAAMASEKPHHSKPVSAKVSKHSTKKSAHADKADKEKSDKKESSEETVVRVKHTKKDGKPTLHHASGVDVGGSGHHEPKVDSSLTVVSATVASKGQHGKLTRVSHVTKSEKSEKADLPKLPHGSQKASASKSGNEKGAHKASSKKTEKAEKADSSDDGSLERDGEFADLVARIRSANKDETDKADKADSKAHAADGKKVSARGCVNQPIEIIRGPEIDTFSLTKCDGTVAPFAIEHLSIAIRPGTAARPTAPVAELAKIKKTEKNDELSPGVHRADERLVSRLQALADHFTKSTDKSGGPVKLSIVSGYRPTSYGSMHASGRAIDFRVDGVKNEDVVAFCKTLNDTGCGYYPNSSFVHLDVRDTGAGHVSWIDVSGPGQSPKYVPSWPLTKSKHEELAPASAREPVETPSEKDSESAPSQEEHPPLPPPK